MKISMDKKYATRDVCAGDRIFKLTIQGNKVTGEFVSQDVK